MVLQGLSPNRKTDKRLCKQDKKGKTRKERREKANRKDMYQMDIRSS